MAWAFTITYGLFVPVTINLYSASAKHAAGYYLNEYSPTAGDDRSGNGVVSENAYLIVVGTSKSDLASKINALNVAAMQARQWQATRQGERVFLNWTPDGYSTARRSELVDIAYQVRSMTYAPSVWGANAAHLDLTITRRNWWEGAQTQVTLTNDNYSSVNSLILYNNNDLTGSAPTKKENWCDLSAIAGDLPCATGLDILLNSPSVNKDVILMVTRSDQAITGGTSGHWVESFLEGSNVVDAACTNGAYRSLSVSSGSTASLTPSIASDYRLYSASNIGVRNYRFFGRVTSSITNAHKMRGVLQAGTTTGTSAPWFYKAFASPSTWTLVDFGAIEYENYYTFYGSKFGRAPRLEVIGGATGSLYVDWVSMICADSYRRYYNVSASADDFGINATPPQDFISALPGNLSPLAYSGDEILFMPGMYHRLYMLTCNTTTGVSDPTDNATIQVFYRPRYLIL